MQLPIATRETVNSTMNGSKETVAVLSAVAAVIVIFSVGMFFGRMSSQRSVAASARSHVRSAAALHTRAVSVAKPPTPQATAMLTRTPNPYPYVEARNSVDMWDSEDDMCSGFRAVAQRLVDGEGGDSDSDRDFVNSLPGHGNLTNGARVAVEDHTNWQCPDSDTVFNMTRVRTSGGKAGYIQEGSLSKQS